MPGHTPTRVNAPLDKNTPAKGDENLGKGLDGPIPDGPGDQGPRKWLTTGRSKPVILSYLLILPLSSVL